MTSEVARSKEPRPPLIRVRGLIKDFPIGMKGLRLRAVDNLDLEVREGEIFGLLGPNGSGKSTTIKVLLGLMRATAGEARIEGLPVGHIETHRHIGYLPEGPYFYKYMTGHELVSYYGKLCGLRGAPLQKRVAEVLELVSMSDAANRKVGQYSKGMLQRIGIAQALVHDPSLLILDEPTAGVDPVGTIAIADIIRTLNDQGKTILLCTHLLSQVEQLCDTVAVMNRGQLLLTGKISELLEEQESHLLRVGGFEPGMRQRLDETLQAQGLKLESVSKPRRTLEALFRELVLPKTERGDHD